MSKHVVMAEFCKNNHFSTFSYNFDSSVTEEKGKKKISFPGNFSFFPLRQNSLTLEFESNSSSKSTCWCSGEICQQQYLRHSKYPRIIEPSSKLTKCGNRKKVQIRIPKELQSHIGYGSCKHSYRALVTLITYVQIKCGFTVKPALIQTFRPPSREKYVHARRIIMGFGLPVNFYVNIWAPTFQCRFVASCGGIIRIQNYVREFFDSDEKSVTWQTDALCGENLTSQQCGVKYPLEDLIPTEVQFEWQTDALCGENLTSQQWVVKYPLEDLIPTEVQFEADLTQKEDTFKEDFKAELLHVQRILSDRTMADVRKMSLCTGILYEAIKTKN